MKTVDCIIHNARIINPSTEARGIVPRSILISDGRILAILPGEEVRAEYRADTELDAGRFYVFPGLVNTHTHLFQVLAKGLGKGLPLWSWLNGYILKMTPHIDEQALYWAALAGCLESIHSGCTTLLDYQYCRSRAGHFDAVCQAFRDSGIRGYVGRARYTETYGSESGIRVESNTDYFRNVGTLAVQMERPDLLNVALLAPALPGALDSPGYAPSFWRDMHLCAEAYKIPYTMHLAETMEDDHYLLEKTGMRSIEYLDRQAFFGPRCVLAHCVQMSESDFPLFAARGVKVSHNAVSNMLLASGVCPVSRFLEHGIAVGLGTDGAGSNDAQDMLETLKMTSLLQKVSARDAGRMTADETFCLATEGGARALCRDDLGCIAPGMRADLFLYDPAKLHSAPVYSPVDSLIYASSQANVDTVLIDGRVVLRGGRHTSISEECLVEQVERAARQLHRSNLFE